MTFAKLISNTLAPIQSIIILGVVVGLLYFMWGIVRYLLAYEDEKARKDSVATISHGLIGLFAMVALWALVEIISESILGPGIGVPQFG